MTNSVLRLFLQKIDDCMAKHGRLLIVDDNKGIITAVKLLTENLFEEVLTLSSPNTLITTLNTHSVDVVLLDMNFHAGINTGNEGLYWLKEILGKFPDTKVVLFTAYADIDLAVKAMKHGAYDFVVKPWNNEKLLSTLQKACRDRRKKGKSSTGETKQSADASTMYWGESAEMKRIRAIVERIAPTDANVLITGENGTGKMMLAREIHALSTRCRLPMISLDMGAVPETLFESELFGHRKGAFTDAHTDRVGTFERADGSTLFLDEIGNLPLQMQSKMLSALQNRVITRIGANEVTPIDIRLISATNSDLQEAVERGDFRQDLLFRINTIHLHIPPLRSRREDIIPLAQLFLKRYATVYRKSEMQLTAEAVEQLTRHSWSGNIRELQNTMEKAVILCDGSMIDSCHIELQRSSRPMGEMQTLEDMERQAIDDAIKQCGGNLSMVAQQLGITRQTLYNKIKRYGL